jgi:hypothetical protein
MSTKEVLTNDQIEAHALELEKKYSCKILPVAFIDEDNGEKIIGYMKEPPRMVKYRVFDKASHSPFTAASELLEACLIQEESDPRILSERPEHDKFNLGAAAAALSLLTLSASTYKKK